MVNTRILEQRLGWRSSDPDKMPEPPTRPIGHAPMLQGRVQQAERTAPSRGPRGLAVADAWDRLPTTDLTAEALIARSGLVPAIDRGAVAGAAFDQFRTQLMRVLKSNDWRRIGITSPKRGAGRSFFAAGLAASVARLENLRVLLIDADLQAPGLAEIFDTAAPGPLEAVLTGQTDPETHLLRIGNGLAVAMNDTVIPYGAELLLAPDAILALRAMYDLLAPDVVVFDMPPLLNDTVSQALLPQLDAVLLISDGKANTGAEIIECERLLEGQVPVIGIALNKSEDRDTRPASRRRF
ncbi:CpsD/CapB family tyrosine-protein kinase [Pararhodobacter sp.]|uniref:CpsD/CapB family tyrosine-protein kinase n=1 Tax=Pararhodobacter sp. TaxID=2127056 RepID=UPI002AFF3664|nr:CpsD/CapB family tyrosine-protein kinase [Pararhodobacter sp.]